MGRNAFSRTGRSVSAVHPVGAAKSFFVVPSGTTKYNDLAAMYPPDEDGVVRVYTTVDAAIGACVANRGDVIYVSPGHTETLDAASDVTCDIAGISIVGLGNGSDRPTFTFDGSDATPSIVVSAGNVLWKNCVFVCNEASQTHMFDVKGDDLTIEDCEFREGTATGLSFVTADTADNDSDRLTIRRCKFHAPTAGNYDNAISLAKDFTGVRIEDCEFYGDFDDAAISIPAGGNAQVDCQIKNCTLVNLQSGQHGIEINGTNSTGKIINCYVQTDALATSVDAGGLEMFNVYFHDGTDQAGWTPLAVEPDSVANILGADDSDNGFASTNVADNRDGSVLERLESIIATLRDDVATNFIGVDDADNVAATTNVVANKDGSILERLEDITQELSGTTGIASFPTAAPAANNVSMAEVLRYTQDLAALLTFDRNSSRYLSVTADFTSATWNTVAAHEIATVTGAVRMVILPQVAGTITSAGGAATLILGDETTTNSLIASTDAEQLAAGEWWADTTTTRTVLQGAQLDGLNFVIGGGKDVGYTIGTEALTGGSIVFHIWWVPISSDGAVAAGTGAAL